MAGPYPRAPGGLKLIGSVRLRGWGCLNCVKVEVEQDVALVTLVLVLLPEPDYLLQDLDVPSASTAPFTLPILKLIDAVSFPTAQLSIRREASPSERRASPRGLETIAVAGVDRIASMP